MPKVSRFIAVLCFISLFYSLLIGCAGANQTASPKASEASSSSPMASAPAAAAKPKDVTLRFSWWGGDARHKATLSAIELYMKQNPHVKIEPEYGGVDAYRQKLVTQLAGGGAADVIQVDKTWLADMIAQGEKFADLNQFKNIIDMKGFDEKFINDFTVVNGRLQGLPMGVNGMTLIYNKTLLTKAGIPLETEWTWEKILEVGKKLNQDNKNLFLINADQFTLIDYTIRQYAYQKTGTPWVKDDYTLGFDQAVLTEALTYFKDLLDNKVVEPFSQAVVFNGKKEQNPKWVNGEAGMTLDWSSLYAAAKSATKDELGVSRFPLLKDAKAKGIPLRPSMMLAINDKTPLKEEAAKFVNWFLNDKEAALILGDVRSIPAVSSAKAALVEANKLDSNVAKAVDLAMKDSFKETELTFNKELVDIEKDVVQKLAFGKSTPDQAAKELIERFEKKLTELKKSK